MEKDFLVYKAAAGSGKTFNLARIFIEELIRKDDSSIDAHLKSIMAITFTHKAANEMKDRVLSFLERINKSDPDDETAAKLIDEISENLGISSEDTRMRCGIALELIMDNFSQLSISTIDSFSHRVVRSFAKELNLHYDFDVSLDYKSWLELAIDRLFDRFGLETKDGTALSNTLIDFFITQFEQGSNWNLKWLLNDFAQKNFNDELHDTYKKHKELADFDLQETSTSLKEPINSYIKSLKKYGQAAMDLISKKDLTVDDFYYKKTGVYGFIEAASKGDNKYKAPNSYVIKTLEEDKWEAAKRSADVIEGIEDIKAELTYYVSEIIALKEDSNDVKVNELILKQIHIMALVSFIVKELELIRQEENILLISDFNLLIDDVVKNDPVPFIYERLGERYKHFLLDEFQDTSVKQWHNFIPLIDNAIAGKNRNLIVGDGKQAIYRFRGGEVELFSELPKIYEIEGDTFNEYQKNLDREFQGVTLEYNFRSTRSIVAFNNAFFKAVREMLGEFNEVYKGVEQIPVLEKEGYVRCEILDSEALKEDDLYLGKTLESIRECVSDGYDYGDIAILARKKDNLKSIATFLSENGIEVVSDESLVLKNQEDISLLVSVMKYLVQPDDLQVNYSLYRSLIFKYENDSYEELEAIDHKYIPLKKKLNKLGFSLDQEYLRTLSLIELSNEIEHIFKLGLSTNAYYTTFLDGIHDYVRANGNQLDGFIEHWEQSDPSISTPENKKAVKLLTIHKAKGLEYPIVIVPYLDWSKRLTRNFHWIDKPEAADISISKILMKMTSDLEETELGHHYLKEKNKSVLDDVNLIYVAFTRAMERLYVYTSNLSGTGTIANEVLSSLSMMNALNEEGIYELGQREIKAAKEEEESTQYFIIEPIKTRTREQNLKVAFEFKKYHSVASDEALKYGKAVHELFSKIETRVDVEAAMDKALKEGYLSTTEIDKLKEKIDRLFKIDLLANWFSENSEKYLEKELVNETGDILRPDRIVIEAEEVSVIDYKTGLVDKKNYTKYVNQVHQYMNALESMGYANVKGYIIAMDEEKVLRI